MCLGADISDSIGVEIGANRPEVAARVGRIHFGTGGTNSKTNILLAGLGQGTLLLRSNRKAVGDSLRNIAR